MSNSIGEVRVRSYVHHLMGTIFYVNGIFNLTEVAGPGKA